MEEEEDNLYEGLEAFITFAESAIEHICLFYHECDVNDFDDVIELAEQVLQLSVLLGDLVGEEVITAFRDLVSALISEREMRSIRCPGRPEVAIGEEQLCFLIEQGFRIQDIADMF